MDKQLQNLGIQKDIKKIRTHPIMSLCTAYGNEKKIKVNINSMQHLKI